MKNFLIFFRFFLLSTVKRFFDIFKQDKLRLFIFRHCKIATIFLLLLRWCGMEIKFKNVSNKLYIYLYGELDEYSSRSIRNLLDNLLEQYLQCKAVIFNFANLSFMDSTGLGFLIGRYKKLKSFNIPVYIESPPLSIEKVLQLSGIYEIMPKI